MSREKSPSYAKNRRLQIKVIAGLLAFVAFGVWFVAGKGGMWETYMLKKQRAEQEAEITLLEARKEKVTDYLNRLRSGDELALETAARRYGLVGPTEIIYDIKVEPAPPVDH
jgi:cell division protein FtsB